MSRAEAQSWIESNIDPTLARSTRLHPLPSEPDGRVLTKREDELSSGVSGSKLRKYASLLPALERQGIEEVALIGGPSSNNIVGLLQLLRERRIRPWLFLRQAGDDTERGNSLFLRMLADPASIRWIQRNDWPNVEQSANTFLRERQSLGRRVRLVPEGGLDEASLPGAATLALDIVQQEASLDQRFDQIFIDSGTGMSAIGLTLGLAALHEANDRILHVTLIAGTETEFRANLDRFAASIPSPLRQPLPSNLLRFHTPPVARSFGSVNATLFQATHAIARDEGLLMDPVYSVKHYLSMKAILAHQGPHRPRSLFIYNGSSLGLAGFQTALSSSL